MTAGRNLAAALLCLATLSAVTPLADLSRLAFLEGSWVSPDGDSEEHWLPAKGGVVLGLHRTIREDGSAFFEYMRIETGERGILQYVANPMGTKGAAFRLSEVGERHAVFVADRRDFPQRIVYRLGDDGVLGCRIEGRGSPSKEWHFVRDPRGIPPIGTPAPAR